MRVLNALGWVIVVAVMLVLSVVALVVAVVFFGNLLT